MWLFATSLLKDSVHVSLRCENCVMEAAWVRNKNQWSTALPLDPHNTALGSWLCVRRTNGAISFGCKNCHLVGCNPPTTFSTLTQRCPRLWVFQKRHVSEEHKACVVKLTSCPSCARSLNHEQNCRSAPTAHMFQEFCLAQAPVLYPLQIAWPPRFLKCLLPSWTLRSSPPPFRPAPLGGRSWVGVGGAGTYRTSP